MIGAARIRHAIAIRGQSQKDVAARLCISESYLSDICTGKRAVSACVAVRLEQILNIDAHKILVDQLLEELKQAREQHAREAQV